MKLIKKIIRFFEIIILLGILGIGGYFIYKNVIPAKVNKVKVTDSIPKYGYRLKENKPTAYKEMFKELKSILSKDEVNEEDYVKKISEMFIYDFYSLKDKEAKTDVGGVEFVHPDVLENFLQNAEDTYYKYVESNIYKNRKQDLPVVDKIKIEEVSNDNYKYNDKSDDNSYIVKVSWKYTSNSYDDYQNEATLVFVHDDIKLYLVELEEEKDKDLE